MGKKEHQDNWDDHEVFVAKGAKIGTPKITLMNTSSFIFNAAFVHQVKLEKFSHVLLGYSEHQKKITFQFTLDSKASGALKVVHRSSGASLGSRSFFNFYFLNPEQLAGSYTPQRFKLPKIGEVWGIDLNAKLEKK